MSLPSDSSHVDLLNSRGKKNWTKNITLRNDVFMDIQPLDIAEPFALKRLTFLYPKLFFFASFH